MAVLNRRALLGFLFQFHCLDLGDPGPDAGFGRHVLRGLLVRILRAQTRR